MAEFYQFASKGKNHYIVFDKYADDEDFQKLVGYGSMMEGDRIFDYRVVKKADDFAILEFDQSVH